jgi:hypothetical protein
VFVDPRLTRLRALVDRLERLPASAQREWALAEARARMVDVETGFTPRAMRALEPDPPIRPAEAPAAQSMTRDAVKRPSSKRRSQVRSRSAQRPLPPVAAPRAAPERAPVDAGAAALGTTDGLLWLEDPDADNAGEPDDGATPWRRGLRG